MREVLSLNAANLTEFQSCRRKFMLSHDYRLIRWRPKMLFDAVLRRAVVALSSGVPVLKAATEATSQFMQAAANPGLDMVKDPYTLARDYCAMLETILRSIAKTTLFRLHEPDPVHLTNSVSWNFLSHADDTGQLHRWITVDSWGRDDLRRELHGWYVFGDVTMARVPMMLHVIEIGQQRNGRRASLWARAWIHPQMPNAGVRFRKTDGRGFGGWDPFYLADHRNKSADEWVGQMWAEGAAQELMHQITVDVPADSVCDDTLRQVMQESARMRTLLQDRGPTSYAVEPMTRTACDMWIPCPYQDVCYREQTVDPITLGLYQEKQAVKVLTQ